MKLETTKPLRVLLPEPDREVILKPGEPTELPAAIAWKVLRRANGTVRPLVSDQADWLALWNHVAEISDGLEPTDLRLPGVLAAIALCDVAFAAGDKAGFLLGIEAVAKALEELPPLSPGWLVVYRNRAGRLCGGADDREHGTVERCERRGRRWMVRLTNGKRLPLEMIRAVSKTDELGRIVAAWRTEKHGYDGKTEGLNDR